MNMIPPLFLFDRTMGEGFSGSQTKYGIDIVAIKLKS